MVCSGMVKGVRTNEAQWLDIYDHIVGIHYKYGGIFLARHLEKDLVD